MDSYYLKYEPKLEAFSISDTVVNEIDLPILELSPADYQLLGCDMPANGAPIIGFVMERYENGYLAKFNSVSALAQTGVKIRFLTYRNCISQFGCCRGLLLAGDSFALPESYYTDPRDRKVFTTNFQRAFVECIYSAMNKHLPILGIGVGAQLIAGEIGLKLYRDFSYVETPIKHNTKKADTHRVFIEAYTPLQDLFGADNTFIVNSRHKGLVAPERVQLQMLAEAQKTTPDKIKLPLDIYAEANDGTPEAWGYGPLHILCVQWHPEDMIAAGDKRMQVIYQWLASESESVGLRK